VIAAAGVPSARAAKTATSIIPIVFTRVGEDLVAGLAHVALTAIRGQNAPTKAGRVLDEDQRRLELLWEGPGRPIGNRDRGSQTLRWSKPDSLKPAISTVYTGKPAYLLRLTLKAFLAQWQTCRAGDARCPPLKRNPRRWQAPRGIA
jgi:hypothetical protein